MATQVLLIRTTHKKHKTNPITPITKKKEKKLEGLNKREMSKLEATITQYKKNKPNKMKRKPSAQINYT